MNDPNDAINASLLSRERKSADVPYTVFRDEQTTQAVRGKKKIGILSYLNLLFTIDTFKKANLLAKQDQSLKENDLPNLDTKDRTENLDQNLQIHYERQKKINKNVKLGEVVKQAHKKEILISFSLDALNKTTRVFTVWVLSKLLHAIVNTSIPIGDCFEWAGLLAVVLILGSYLEQHWMYLATKTGIRIKNGLTRMVYNKLTRISVHSLNDLSIGKIVNVVANDVNIYERRGPFFSCVFLALPTLFGVVGVLWEFFGVGAIVGVAYIVIAIPIQILLIGLSTKPQVQKNATTDERVKITNEVIDSIRLLKMYTWELLFTDSIKKLREKEIGLLKRGATLEGIARGFALSISAMASYLTFLTHVLLGGQITISSVFPTLYIMSFLRLNVLFGSIAGLSFLAESNLIYKRIEQIVEAPEIQEKNFPEPQNSENAAEFHNFTGYWTKQQEQDTSDQQNSQTDTSSTSESQPALRNINLTIKKGSLQALVGTVGAGKSSLMLAFTGEMPRTVGKLCFKGTIAYAEQEPTIFPGLLRENILFGKEYEPEFYSKVVEACCLENDFKQFDKGDLTEIGEKGVNLSGGQKARIALARAIYSQADIYLLDDPLSAVDAKVAKRLYENAICGMLSRKTVILATHQVHFIKDLENIIVMSEGKIIGQGNFAQLSEQNVDAEGIFSIDKNGKLSFTGSFGPNGPELARAGSRPLDLVRVGSKPPVMNTNPESDDEEQVKTKGGDEDEKGKLISAEDPSAGRVTMKTYGEYIKAMGSKWHIALLMLSVFAAVFADMVFSRFAGLWAQGDLTRGEAFVILGSLVAVIFIAYMVKSIVFAVLVLNGAKRLHDKLIDRIIRNPVKFFDTNPVGRILNRFSNDVGVLDKGIPLPLEDFLTISIVFLIMFVAIAVITPSTLGPICLGSFLIFFIVRFCQEGVKQTKIYELDSRSPVYSLFSMTLAGLISIRSYSQVGNFRNKFTHLLDNNLRAHLAFTSSNQFLGISVDLAYTVVSVSTILLLMLFRDEEPSLLGLTLSFIMILCGMLQFNLRVMIQMKILMSSTARILSYCNTQPELPLAQNKDQELRLSQWPQHGKIEFQNVYMRYRENTEHVIKGLTLQVQPGEKIGCIGRTGAGKSSILQMLFRMVEIDREGRENSSYIKIDGVDIQEIGLHLLRNNISIIPQTPVVFSGTIRRNLDPLNQHSDEDLWYVLQEVNLKDYVENIEGQLYADMTNAASVFSVGQKQLICLARAILKKSKIVVLDEATANVDTQTDNFIQHKIMERFGDCTIFTIAHRLSTIANYDKVLVLEKGQRVEFDAPYRLLVKEIGDSTITNKEGHFASMVLNTGPKAARNIFKKAKAKYYEGSEEQNGEDN